MQYPVFKLQKNLTMWPKKFSKTNKEKDAMN